MANRSNSLLSRPGSINGGAKGSAEDNLTDPPVIFHECGTPEY
ncbi:MAG TPA: hypothetical protein VGO47_06915 [Chlamydiales bacterium]|nr:hypothetical protein [Chlamydiales bacterium]